VSPAFDRRITPARRDVAAAHLKGKVEAAAFVEGRTVTVARGRVGLRAAPSDDAGLETELLFGETFTIYAEESGWAWGQAALDSYVGYARADSFAAGTSVATHRVTALATPLLTAPDVKKPARDLLPLNAKLAVAEETRRFHRTASGHYVFTGHAASLSSELGVPDWVAVAERFLSVPYLWGGKTAAGIDCSGLVQTALAAVGTFSPRDTDMMETALGEFVPLASPLRRGDLIFWKGHVGVMLDATRLLHANAFFMEVTAEPLTAARDRIALSDGHDIRTIKRLSG
jgi:cell wall-associated NlpC family hydrolase